MFLKYQYVYLYEVFPGILTTVYNIFEQKRRTLPWGLKTRLLTAAPKASRDLAPAYDFPLFKMRFLDSPLHSHKLLFLRTELSDDLCQEAFPDYTPISYPRLEDVLLLSVPKKPRVSDFWHVFLVFPLIFRHTHKKLLKGGNHDIPTLVLVKVLQRKRTNSVCVCV